MLCLLDSDPDGLTTVFGFNDLLFQAVEPDARIDDLTSRQFMTRSVSTASQNIVKVEKRTVNGKVKNVQVVQSLADFRTANAPSNSGGGPLPVGGDTEVDPEGD